MSNFRGLFFHVFMGKFFFKVFFKKHCSVRTKKLHNTSFMNFIYFFNFVLPQNRLILKFSNLGVLHKGHLMQDWVFRLSKNLKIVT
jgi:hypothetical protein